jgi:hypothetical protein
VGGRRILLAPGEAAWSGDQAQHSHERGSDAAGRFFFFGISPASARGGPSGGTVRDTEDVALGAGVYDVVLSEARLPAAGDTVTLPVRGGPTGLWLVEGQATIGGQALAADGAVLVRPGTPATLSTDVGGARVLALTLSPEGPAQLPRTGEAASSRPALLAVLACAAGLVATAWLARRRKDRRD